MAKVLLEGVFRAWVDVDADNERDAFDKAGCVNLEQVIGVNVPTRDIEDFVPVEFLTD